MITCDINCFAEDAFAQRGCDLLVYQVVHGGVFGAHRRTFLGRPDGALKPDIIDARLGLLTNLW